MDNSQLERSLQSIGKACFVKHYELFTDHRVDGADAAEYLLKAERFTEKACSTRVSHARAIIRAGRANDALRNIAKSGRVPNEWRDKAMNLVRS